jgi:hypothetical protein
MTICGYFFSVISLPLDSQEFPTNPPSCFWFASRAVVIKSGISKWDRVARGKHVCCQGVASLLWWYHYTNTDY